jgi:hypothetical protein
VPQRAGHALARRTWALWLRSCLSPLCARGPCWLALSAPAQDRLRRLVGAARPLEWYGVLSALLIYLGPTAPPPVVHLASCLLPWQRLTEALSAWSPPETAPPSGRAGAPRRARVPAGAGGQRGTDRVAKRRGATTSAACGGICSEKKRPARNRALVSGSGMFPHALAYLCYASASTHASCGPSRGP